MVLSLLPDKGRSLRSQPGVKCSDEAEPEKLEQTRREKGNKEKETSETRKGNDIITKRRHTGGGEGCSWSSSVSELRQDVRTQMYFNDKLCLLAVIC